MKIFIEAMSDNSTFLFTTEAEDVYEGILKLKKLRKEPILVLNAYSRTDFNNEECLNLDK
jgi:hypothetical protein